MINCLFFGVVISFTIIIIDARIVRVGIIRSKLIRFAYAITCTSGRKEIKKIGKNCVEDLMKICKTTESVQVKIQVLVCVCVF